MKKIYLLSVFALLLHACEDRPLPKCKPFTVKGWAISVGLDEEPGIEIIITTGDNEIRITNGDNSISAAAAIQLDSRDLTVRDSFLIIDKVMNAIAVNPTWKLFHFEDMPTEKCHCNPLKEKNIPVAVKIDSEYCKGFYWSYYGYGYSSVSYTGKRAWLNKKLLHYIYADEVCLLNNRQHSGFDILFNYDNQTVFSKSTSLIRVDRSDYFNFGRFIINYSSPCSTPHYYDLSYFQQHPEEVLSSVCQKENVSRLQFQFNDTSYLTNFVKCGNKVCLHVKIPLRVLENTVYKYTNIRY